MNMKKFLFILAIVLLTPAVMAQEDLQKGGAPFGGKKTCTTIMEVPITSVKYQYKSGTCWDYGTLGFFIPR